MLSTIDKALAGAIDVIADDVSATVKSVREQGMMRTLGDAVEDAAGLVAGGAKSVLSGMGKNKPEKGVSSHSGIQGSSYADLCAAGAGGFQGGGFQGGGGFQAGGGAAFPYQPNAGAAFPYQPMPSAGRGKSGAAAAPKVTGGFGPGIGIQRNPASAGYNNGGVPIFASSGTTPAPAAGFGGYAGYQGGAAQNAPAAPAPSYSSYNSSAAVAASPSSNGATGGKDPTLSQGEILSRFNDIKARDPSNNVCFDCPATTAEWASVSFGIFVCIECSGYHRQMGTHISRIRSIKMDSWTEKQMKVFEHAGNKRLNQFFECNGVDKSLRFQRYHTPAAEWYREAWVKNMTLGREVPPTPEGVSCGPCTGTAKPAKQQAAAAKAAPAAPTVDLLDMGGEAAKKAPAAVAPSADLLSLGGDTAPAASQAPASSDLLGVGTSSTPASNGDILGLGSLSAAAAPAAPGGGADLQALAATAASARPSPMALASTPASVPGMQPAPASNLGMLNMPTSTPAMAVAAAPTNGAGPTNGQALGGLTMPTSGTLAGGAKLAEKEKKTDDDPFAMALSKWGM